jgi:hypothetical protein
MAKPKVEAIHIVVMPDQDPDTSYLDQKDFEDRKAAYERGDFTFVGIQARAEVVIAGVIQEIASGGLWGIESDSGEKYFREVGKEEYSGLKDILKDMGATGIPPFKSVRLKELV